MRKIATTTNYGLYLNDDDSETFISWRNKINGDTGESNMDIIDEALGDFSSHVSDSNIHVTEDEKELWGSSGFSWNLLKDTKTLSDWTRSSTSGITLEEDEDGFYAAYFVGSSSTRTRFIRNYVTYEDIAGKECTFSFMGKSDYADSIVEDGGIFRVYVRTYSSTTSSSYSGSVIYTLSSQDITTEWAKFSVTFTYTNSSASDDSPIYICINNYSYYDAEIKCPKLEFGSSATEWTPHISEIGSSGSNDDDSDSDTSSTTDLTTDVTGVLSISNGGTGNSSGTAAGLTTAVNLDIDLSTSGTVSFDGTTDATIPVSSSSGALPVSYGGTGATTAASALYNIGYSGGTTAYYLTPGSYYIPFVGSSSSYSKKMTLSRLINSAVAGGTSVDLDDYTSYYIPLVSGTASNSSTSANSTYKFTPSDLLAWVKDNISTTINLTSDVEGILPYTNGGTSASSYADALYNLINGSDELSTLATADYLGVLDYSATTGKKISISDLLTYLSSTIDISSNSNIVAGVYTGEYDYDTTTFTNVVSVEDQAALAIVGALDNYSTRYGTRPQWLFYVDDDGSIIMETCFGYTLYDGTTDYDWYGKNASSGSDPTLYFYHSSSGTMYLRVRNRCYENTAGDSYETSFNLDGITYFYIIIYL